MNRTSGHTNRPIGGIRYVKKLCPDRKRQFGIIALVSLTIIMAGMNWFPNNWIDQFPYNNDKVTDQKQIVAVRNKFYDEKVVDRFKSVDDLVAYVRRNAPDTGNELDMARYLNKILKRRFIHAYSVYTTRENWIAVLAGRFVWADLAAKVIPNEIIQGKVAACSQVSIIFMDACSKLGIHSRKVGMMGHYALETFADGEWHFFDADMKPNFAAIKGHKSLEKILSKREHFRLYANTPCSPQRIATLFSKIHYGIPNENPAPRASLFHVVTKAISHWGWLVPLIGAIFLISRKEKAGIF